MLERLIKIATLFSNSVARYVRLLFRADALAEANSASQYTPSPENKTKLPLTSVVAMFSSKQLMPE